MDMLTLFDDVQVEVIKIEEAEIEETVTIGEHKQMRKPKEKHIEYRLLPKEEVIWEYRKKKRSVRSADQQWKKYEAKEELIYEPYRLYIRVTKIPVLECENCQSINEEGKSSYHTVKHAFLYPKSLCSAELLTYIIDMKYSNSFPLDIEQHKKSGVVIMNWWRRIFWCCL